MTRRAEPCPVPGCIDPKARGHLMCRHHWRQVDAVLRKAVNAAWKAVSRDTRAAGTNFEARLAVIGRYRAATAAAIQYITDRTPQHVE